MPSKNFTSEQKRFIDECYGQHPSVKSIAQKYREKFGVIAEATIAKFLRANKYEVFARGKKPPLSEETKRRMMLLKLPQDIDVSKYSDYSKLSFLSKRYSHYQWKWDLNFSRLDFFDRFYFDKKFNSVFDQWKQNDEHILLIPSFDHILPTCRGGETTLDNLQCLPVWENRAKYSLTQDEWKDFRRKFVT